MSLVLRALRCLRHRLAGLSFIFEAALLKTMRSFHSLSNTLNFFFIQLNKLSSYKLYARDLQQVGHST